MIDLPEGWPQPLRELVFDEEMAARFPMTPMYEKACEYHHLQNWRALVNYMLFYSTLMPVYDGKGMPEQWKEYVPSTLLGSGMPGPMGPVEVMVIGKMPGVEELTHKCNFCGPAGQILKEVAAEAGCDTGSWYISNVVRFLPQDGGKSLKPQHVADCMFLLAQEIALVKPKFLLLLGADATRAVCGRKATLERLRSQVMMFHGPGGIGSLPVPVTEDMVVPDTAIRVLATTHPARVLHEIGYRDGLKRDLELFASLTSGRMSLSRPGTGCDYRVVRSFDALKAVVTEVLDGGFRELAVDCEWSGSDFMNGSLRTIQFSWARGKACVIVLATQGGVPAQDIPERFRIIDEFRRLVETDGMKVFGHNLRADAKWLENMGIPIMRAMSFDTMLADHILNENAEHDLTSCVVRHTDMGRYDYAVDKWLLDHHQTKKVTQVRGYRDIPDDILHLYGACDADGTFRCAKVLQARLALPENAHVASCFYDVVMPCNYPLHEIEVTGVPVDRDLMVQLVGRFDVKKTELLEKLRVELKRPEFNPRSYLQVKALLFGPPPDGLDLTPYKTTGKPARMWEDLIVQVSPHEMTRVSPSTDAETLEALAGESPIVSMLHDFKTIDQVTKSFLRVPDDWDAEEMTGEDYTSGLVYAIDSDGRTRTSLSQMSETGRQKSSQPNLTNLPKKQDKELERIMGDIVPIRSCFIALPGHVLIEADYKSAELYTLGYLSNCSKLIRDIGGDLHARGAVSNLGAPAWAGFDNLALPPDEWLKAYKHLRISQKTINFGIPYQRGAKAIAREIEKTTKGKVHCSAKEAQEMIDGFYRMYPEVKRFVEFCKARATNPGWLENPYGRRRRVYSGADEATIAAQQRELVNFPIQSSVADTLNVALYNLWYWRQMCPGRAAYQILLAIHDAVLLAVPGMHVVDVVEHVLPECMSFGVRVPRWDPDPGQYARTQAFTLAVDISVGVKWGEDATAEELRMAQVPENVIERFA